MKKEKVFYYKAYSDDFFCEDKPLPEIDGSYVYIKRGFFYKMRSFIAYRLIAAPIAFIYSKLVLRDKFVGKEKLRAYKKKPYFLYGNHTQPIGDAFSPNVLVFPKKLYVIVDKANLALPVIKKATGLLGALPLPDGLAAGRNFHSAIKTRLSEGAAIAVYPEAHVWPYYTGIRPFGEETLDFPVRTDTPVFTITRVYKKRKHSQKPRSVIYVDGPFFPDGELPKRERRKKLRDEVYSAMKERAALSDTEYYKYYMEENAQPQSEQTQNLQS